MPPWSARCVTPPLSLRLSMPSCACAAVQACARGWWRGCGGVVRDGRLLLSISLKAWLLYAHQPGFQRTTTSPLPPFFPHIAQSATGVGCSSVDVEYHSLDGSWVSATAGTPRFLRGSDTLRLAVDKGAAYNGAPTLYPSRLEFTPIATHGSSSPAATSAFGFVIASSATGTPGDVAYFAITNGSAWAGAFTLTLQADTMADTDGTTDALAGPASGLTMAFVETGGLYTSATSGSSASGTPLVPGVSDALLRIVYASSTINGAAALLKAGGSVATGDMSIDSSKITVKDASNNVYTLEQPGLTITTGTAAGVTGDTGASWGITVSNTRMGGISSVSFTDGAFCNTDGSWCSVAVTIVASNLQVRGAADTAAPPPPTLPFLPHSPTVLLLAYAIGLSYTPIHSISHTLPLAAHCA